jgi:serine/threonine-protein kinase
MPLDAGTRVGSYEVVAKLGQGGMGEVYKARDARLGRDVALKILSGGFDNDRSRLARFEREAKTLASLNHPHIAQIYGVEELNAGPASGIALVMELVEGDDLSAQIARGPVPARSATAIARQIVDALAAAHERGVVHRDLKPANIKVRADGTVKVLDFGLARDTPAGDDMSVPTITALTEHHAVVGTPAYMSPEQATGRSVDHRTDVWAFGCVLYEMLSGRRTFAADTSVETFAAVINGDPDWTAIGSAPASLQTLVRRCLQKDVRQRLHHMADVRMWLDEPLTSSAAVAPAAVPAPRRRVWPMLAAVIAAAVIGAAAMFPLLGSRATPPQGIIQFEITPPENQPFTPRPSGGNMTVSPDGSMILYHAVVGDTFQVMRRRLDDVVATPIPGTERAQMVTFSPDGQQLAFFSGGAIRTLPVAGGTPAVVCEWASSTPFIAWLDSGELALVHVQGLMTVPVKGGTPQLRVAPDPAKGELEFFGVMALPGGTVATKVVAPRGGRWQSRLAALAPGATEFKTLIEGVDLAQYVAGHFVFTKGGVAQIARLDAGRLETGEPRVLEKIRGLGAIGNDGTFVYQVQNQAPAGAPAVKVPIKVLDAQGRLERTIATDAVMSRQMRVSPDGNRLAISTGGLNWGVIWIHDVRGSAQPIRLTFSGAWNFPIWGPGGDIFMQTPGPGALGMASIPIDGSTTQPKVLVPDGTAIPEDWSPDGATLLYQTANAKTGADLQAFDRASGGSRAWLQTSFSEAEARFSPDGKVVAFASDQTGRYEVWIRPFAGGTAIRVSSDGGHEPQWSHDGRQLFFQNAGKIMASAVTRLPELGAAPPRLVFDGGFVPYNTTWRRTFGVLPDGRFVVFQPLPEQRLSLVVVMHALDEILGLRPR